MFNNYKKNDTAKADSPFGDSNSLDKWAAPASPDPVAGEGGMNGFFGTAEAASPTFGTAAPASSPVAPVSPGATRNVLGSDVSVVGMLRFTDDLLVDGSVEGEISSDGVLTVGANARIQAGDSNSVAVRTKSAVIHGKVTGDIVVSDRVELASTAELVGDVTASRIAIQEGAVFIGHCSVGASSAPVPPPPSKKGAKSSKNTAGNLLS